MYAPTRTKQSSICWLFLLSLHLQPTRAKAKLRAKVDRIHELDGRWETGKSSCFVSAELENYIDKTSHSRDGEIVKTVPRTDYKTGKEKKRKGCSNLYSRHIVKVQHWYVGFGYGSLWFWSDSSRRGKTLTDSSLKGQKHLFDWQPLKGAVSSYKLVLCGKRLCVWSTTSKSPHRTSI